MRRILVATDLSPASDRALRRATLLAKMSGADLILLHAVDGDGSEGSERRAILENLARTASEADGVACEPLVRPGRPDEVINAVAASRRVDLTVLGRPHWRLSDLFAGSTGPRALKDAPGPVLVARGVPASGYEQVLLATDFSPSARRAARAAKGLGLLAGARTAAMTAYEDPTRSLLAGGVQPMAERDSEAAATARQDLARFADDLGRITDERLADPVVATAAEAIRQAARRVRADLIVIGARGRGGIEGFLLGGVAQDLIQSADADLLVVAEAPAARQEHHY